MQGAPSGLQPGTSEEYTVPQFTFEELEGCDQLGGAKAFRLTADLKRCATTRGTGIKVASDMLTFRAKEVGYELMYKWPQPIDEKRATTKFSRMNRELTDRRSDGACSFAPTVSCEPHHVRACRAKGRC